MIFLIDHIIHNTVNTRPACGRAVFGVDPGRPVSSEREPRRRGEADGNTSLGNDSNRRDQEYYYVGEQ